MVVVVIMIEDNAVQANAIVTALGPTLWMKYCQFERARAQTASSAMDEDEDDDDVDDDDDDDDSDDEEKEERKARKRAAAAAGGQLPLDDISTLRDLHDRALEACGQHFTMVRIRRRPRTAF